MTYLLDALADAAARGLPEVTAEDARGHKAWSSQLPDLVAEGLVIYDAVRDTIRLSDAGRAAAGPKGG